MVALLAPLASVILAFAVAAPNDDQRWTTGGCALATAGSLVLLIAGQHPQVARLAPDDLALAAASATALLALSVRGSVRGPTVAAAVTVAMCGLTAGSPGRPSTVGPLLGVAAAVILVAMARDADRLLIALVGTGVVVAAAGLRAGGRGGVTAVVVGVALVATVAALVSRRSLVVVIPAALVLGIRLGPALAGTSTGRWLAVALAVGGAALVLVPAVVRGFASPAYGAVLVPWTLVAAVGPVAGTTTGTRPLAAGAVVALALGGTLSLLAAVPGSAVLTYALADAHGWPRATLSLLLGATLFGLALRRPRADGGAARLRVVDGAALALGVWFVVRPTSWAWTRLGDLRAYSDGTVLALASALIAGVLFTGTRSQLEYAPLAPWLVAADHDDRPVGATVNVLAVAVSVLTGLIAAALVRSARL
ncbi:MAG: hypothetical protein QOC92_4410 [Acidimicrobiaceae bacterium]